MPNRPKGKLFALLAIFVAIGLVTATGAFSTVQAQRTVTVDTAGDSAALLQLEGNSSSGGASYISTSGSPAEILIDFRSSNLPGTASGVNVNATTNVSHLINVTNNGASDINFYVTTGTTPAGVTLDFYQGSDTTNSVVNSGNAVTITAGTKESIGISVDLNSGVTSFNTTVTFNAESV